MASFGEIWNRIEIYEGDTFRQKLGGTFTYSIIGTPLNPSRTDYNIGKAEFEKAYQWVPLAGPGKMNNEIRGPSYVWAILHDSRIRRSDW